MNYLSVEGSTHNTYDDVSRCLREDISSLLNRRLQTGVGVFRVETWEQ